MAKMGGSGIIYLSWHAKFVNKDCSEWFLLSILFTWYPSWQVKYTSNNRGSRAMMDGDLKYISRLRTKWTVNPRKATLLSHSDTARISPVIKTWLAFTSWFSISKFEWSTHKQSSKREKNLMVFIFQTM